jgi:hypothetical protein
MSALFDSIRSSAGIIIAAILGLIALFILLRALQGWAAASASRAWPSVSGRVLNSSLIRTPRRGTSGGGSYVPMIVYEYQVDGKVYRGQRYSFGTQVGTGFTGIASRVVDRYPEGSAVDVYYNPENPSEAVLKRSAGGSWGNLLMVVVLAAAAVIVLVRFGGVRLPF